MRSTGNLGNGIFAFSDGALGASSPYDTGLFVGLESCELDSNTQAGIEMRASDYLTSDSAPQLTQQAAIVGGTWDLQRSLIEEGNEPMSGIIPHRPRLSQSLPHPRQHGPQASWPRFRSASSPSASTPSAAASSTASSGTTRAAVSSRNWIRSRP